MVLDNTAGAPVVDGALVIAGDPELGPPQEDRIKAEAVAPHATTHPIRFRHTIQPC
jgi:hypothetical protein